MPTSFVATKAPSGWKLGRWSQVDAQTWEERKLDNPKESYNFSAVGDGVQSSAVRLHLQGTTTEVLILETSVQIFVDGRYFGEYLGRWDGAGAAAPRGPSAGGVVAGPPRGAAAQYGAPPPVMGGPPPVMGGPPAGSPGADLGGKSAAPAGLGGPPPAIGGPPPAIGGPPPVFGGPPGGGSGPSPGMKSAPPPNTAGRGASKPQQAAPAAAVSAPARSQKAANLDNSPAMVEKLHAAAKNGDVGEVQRLLGQGIDPDGQSRDGSTALYYAADKGQKQVVEALLGASADPNIGQGDKTPMVAAFSRGHKDILSLLFASTFSTLDNAVGGGVQAVNAMAQSQGFDRTISPLDDEAPNTAHDELREMTTKLSRLGKTELASDWSNSKMPHDIVLPENADSDMAREEQVRMAMQTLVNQKREEEEKKKGAN